MLKFLKRLPGRVLRLTAVVGVVGMVLAVISTLVSPATLSWMAFFGLTYLFWLIVSLVGLVYSIVRKRWFFVGLVVVTLGFTWNQVSSTFQVRGASHEIPEISMDHSLNVMSYNVRLFDLYNWTEGSATRDKIFEFLADNPADVLCFQEFYHTDRKGVFETRDTLVQFLGNKHFHEKYTHEMNGKQYFGVVTFSKYPIVNRGEMPFASDVNNFCIYTDVLVDEDTIRVYNAHMASIRFQKEDYKAIEEGPNKDEAIRLADRLKKAFVKRASQAEKIRAHMSESPYPVVVCGDFNDTPVSYAYNQLSADLNDCFIENGSGLGSTYIGAIPGFRIDYILHEPSLKNTWFYTHQQKESDHRPIQAVFEW